MVPRKRESSRAHRTRRAVGALAATSLAGQYVPSLVALGQWTPLRALPLDLCRWRGPKFPASVALTFDDGPDPTATPAVLDKLDELRMAATFFPLASLAERYPDLIEEIARRGHVVGTHGYEHGHHLLHGPGWVRRDLDAAERVLHDLGRAPEWYRPTYGQASAATLVIARSKGWRPVLWSAWGREWAGDDPRRVADRIGRRLRPGAIVLLHDNDLFGAPGMWRTALAALDMLASRMERGGLRAVTLDDLVA
jgi:peptidoglycan-N-acetylglucosamine deacetylase